MAVGDWGNSAGGATVTVEVYPDGTVIALSGSQDIGTGFPYDARRLRVAPDESATQVVESEGRLKHVAAGPRPAVVR